ncbi:MAG: hypothetical protein ACRDZ8_19365 [Acidimicrobiales bacterium]
MLAFLRGELGSHRFGDAVRAALDAAGGPHLVTSPDLNSESQNRARAAALTAARDWRANRGLFAGFPDDVTWCHGILDPHELSRVRFINYSYWVELSGGSRRPADVLATVRAATMPAWMTEIGTDWCFELAERLSTATAVGDLIIMATPDFDDLVLLEGHAALLRCS